MATSGTAAAELHPAVVEADLGRVPLICCTCDRPFELHHVGASQTIDQSRLYGDAARFAIDTDSALTDGGVWRSLASRCFVEATAGPAWTRSGAGEHRGLCAEPLIETLSSSVAPRESADAKPVASRTAPERRTLPAMSTSLIALLRPNKRGLIVVGAGACPSGDPRAIYALACVASPGRCSPTRRPTHAMSLHGWSYTATASFAATSQENGSFRKSSCISVHRRFLECCRATSPRFMIVACARSSLTHTAPLLDPGRIADLVVTAAPSELALGLCRTLGR